MTTPPSTDPDRGPNPDRDTNPGRDTNPAPETNPDTARGPETNLGPETKPDTAPGPDTTAPYTLGLRLAAACGLLFLLACLVFTGMITLDDAIEGDGSGGVLIAAGFWSLALGAVAGVAALVVPRRALVAAQYCLGAAGPLLALMD
ncbi:hypothetical protein ACF064_13000 [Streptomyces sp. NPDC015492]|uniref:hypothetical protein n=1 Tax=Streptomyces sp. NPDC015492 TaxID=3364958 RepID=UPI0036FF3951